MFLTVAAFSARTVLSSFLLARNGLVTTLSGPELDKLSASRVALMLREMYGASLEDSDGSTLKRCTNAGYAPPTITATNAHRPTASTGSTQPRRQMFTMKRTT